MSVQTMIQRRPTSTMGEISPTAQRAATTLPPQSKVLKVSSSQGLPVMRAARDAPPAASLMGVALAAPRW